MKIPVMIQMQPDDNGLTALAMVMAAYGRYETGHILPALLPA